MIRDIVLRIDHRPWIMYKNYMPTIIHYEKKKAYREKLRLEAKYRENKFTILHLNKEESIETRVLSFIDFFMGRPKSQGHFSKEGRKEWEEKYSKEFKDSIGNTPCGIGTAELSANKRERSREKQMAIKVTHPVFINGSNEGTFTTNQLIDLIRQSKASCKSLVDVECKSVTIDKLVAKEEAGIADLVKVLDSRVKDIK